MSEFNMNDENQNDSGNQQLNNQNQNNNIPNYSFWAEQVPSNSNFTNNYYGANNWQNNNNNFDNNQSTIQQVNEKKPGKGRKAADFLLKSICFGLIAGISFLGLQKLTSVVYPEASSVGLLSSINKEASYNKYEIGFTKAGEVKTKERTVISSVTDTVKPSIVSINCIDTQTGADIFGQEFNQDMESRGSGIIVGKNDKELLIATNNHVVEGADKITITFTDGKEALAEIKGTDSTADLAVVTVDIKKLKTETLSAITVAKLGNSDNIKVGEMSIAIGNALGYGQSVTVGYISALDREVEVSDENNSKKMTFLQTDAAINPGNSGGALINVDGQVIGINTVKYASEEVEGMGYAIPISKAMPIITELMNREILNENEQGYLGITGFDVTEDVSKAYDFPIGVYIKDVSEGGAAEKAGLKSEDIITKVNDMEITSFTQLKDKINNLRVGTEVEITYMRNTDGDFKKAQVKVTLGKNPSLQD